MIKFSNYQVYIKYIGNILAFTSLLIIVHIVKTNLNDVKHVEFSYTNIVIFSLIILLVIFNYFLLAFSWREQLKGKYPLFQLSSSIRIVSLTQIAKYLPGNFGHFLGKFYLSTKYIKKPDIIFTMLVENIMFVLSSCFVGSFYFLFFDISTIIKIDNLLLISTTIILILLISYFIFTKFRQKIDLIRIDKIIFSKVFLIFIIMSLMGSLSICLLINLISPNSNLPFLLVISGFSISFLVGFIVPGAPGGIGVREYAFTILFSPFIGKLFALEVILLFRILSLIADVVLFILGKYLNKKHLVNQQ